MRVLEIWRYPVKSLGGERVGATEIGDAGIVGDRGWGILDVENGTVLTARRAPELLFASARLLEAGRVAITLPDGTEVQSDGADPSAADPSAADPSAADPSAADAALSDWLGRSVSLVRPGTEGATYENPMDIENEADWISWQGPSWSFHDSTKSMLSIVGVDTLAGRDVRRFRTNIVVEGSGEDALVGAQVSLGSARLHVVKPIDRCIMVTRPQPGLERDLEVLKRVIAERDNLLSVGALVVEAGSVAVGDEWGRVG